MNAFANPQSFSSPMRPEALECRRLLAVTLDWGVSWGYHEEYFSAEATAVDTQGNVYVAGTFTHQVDVDPSQSGTRVLKAADSDKDDIYVAKYDSGGALVWAQRFGGDSNDTVDVLTLGPDGQLYVGGTFKDPATFGTGSHQIVLTSRGGKDGYIVRLNPDTGQLVWGGIVGGKRDDQVTAIAVGPAGELYMAASIRIEGDIDPSANTIRINCRGTDDTVIARLDPNNGSVLWHRIFGENPTRETVQRMVANPDGGIIAAGVFNRRLPFSRASSKYTLKSAGGDDIYLLSLSASGSFNHVRRFGGRKDEILGDMTLAPDGDLYLTGTFEKTIDFGSLSRPDVSLDADFDESVFLCRISRAGRLAWATQFGGDGIIIPSAVAVDPAGNVWTTGSFTDDTAFDPAKPDDFLDPDKDNDARLHNQRDSSDVYVSHFVSSASAGTFQSVSTIGGHDGSVIINDIALDASGNLRLVGEFAEEVNISPSGKKKILRTSDDDEGDVLILKFDTGVELPG
jgi:hypothetical protein